MMFGSVVDEKGYGEYCLRVYAFRVFMTYVLGLEMLLILFLVLLFS
jgi:hypothetical protein